MTSERLSLRERITREVFAKVIEKFPNAEWRLLVSLVQFGGLRNTSETLELKWEHVDWIEKTIRVTGSKGKDGEIRWRTIPIFSELIKPLREAFDAEHEYVITKIRGSAKAGGIALSIFSRGRDTRKITLASALA